MGRTSTANGVLIEGYKQNVIYKLKRPITEPTNPGNYLQGTVTSENLDQYKVAYVFDKRISISGNHLLATELKQVRRSCG